MVIGIVATQPLDDVYVIVTVPADNAVTNPEEDTVAVVVLLLLHVPPVVASVNIVVAPIQIFVDPEIDDTELTVTTMFVLHPPAVM